MLVLLFGPFWFILQGDLFYVFFFFLFYSCVFSPFSIAITLLGEECFLYVCSICACLVLSVSPSSWCQGRATVCDCGTPLTFLLPFFNITDRCKAVFPMLFLPFVALWFILRSDLFMSYLV